MPLPLVLSTAGLVLKCFFPLYLNCHSISIEQLDFYGNMLIHFLPSIVDDTINTSPDWTHAKTPNLVLSKGNLVLTEMVCIHYNENKHMCTVQHLLTWKHVCEWVYTGTRYQISDLFDKCTETRILKLTNRCAPMYTVPELLNLSCSVSTFTNNPAVKFQWIIANICNAFY